MIRPLAPVGVLLLLVSACATKPDAPTFDNPYDPNGDGPDPYQLTATVQSGGVFLTWIDNPDIEEWRVFHSTQSADEGFGNGLDLDVNTSGDLRTATHEDYSPAITNWYRLQATTKSGEVRVKEFGAPAVILPPPLVRLAGGGDVTSTRFVTLELRSDQGESVELSNDANFGSPVVVPTTPGEFQTAAFTLPTVTQVPQTLFVHARNLVGGSAGVSDSARIQVRFTPTLSIVRGERDDSTGSVVVDTTLVLSVLGDGVIRARVAGSNSALATATWDDSPDSIDWVLSAAALDPGQLFAEVEGDFGVTAKDSLSYTPAPAVGNPSLSLVGDEETTLDPAIRLHSVVDGASQMIFSEDPAFLGAMWIAFEDTTDFVLSSGLGEKIIFARYRSSFDPVGRSALLRVFLLGGP